MEEKWGELWERLISWGWMVWYSRRFIWNRLSQTLLLLNKHTRTHTYIPPPCADKQRVWTNAHFHAHTTLKAKKTEAHWMCERENIAQGDKRWKTVKDRFLNGFFIISPLTPQIQLKEYKGGNNYFLSEDKYSQMCVTHNLSDVLFKRNVFQKNKKEALFFRHPVAFSKEP